MGKMRSVTLVAAAASLLVLAACGGGSHRVDAITPAHVDVLSGTWIFDEADSDDVQELLAQLGSSRGEQGPAQRGGGAPGATAGGRGGRPGASGMPGRDGLSGGMTGGQRGGARSGGAAGARGGAPMDPQALQATRRLVQRRVPRLVLTLTDSMVTLSYPREEPFQLLLGEEVERELSDGLILKAKAEWQDGRLRFRRAIEGGGSVTELFMPSVDGTLLTVAVEAELGRGPGIEFRRVFRPRPGEDPLSDMGM